MATLTSKIDTHDKGIKSAIATSQNRITNAINGVKNDITNQGTTLKNVINTKGCVKSVQVVNSGNINGFDTYSFNISAVNMKKTILLTDSISNTDLSSFEVIATLTSNTSISVSIGGTSYDSSHGSGGSFTGIVNIQVIEFY